MTRNRASTAYGFLLVVIAVLLVAGCGDEETQPAATIGDVPSFSVTSAAFEDGGTVPVEFTADGADRSPPLSWSGAPDGTQAYALIVDDPDAPQADPFVHWVVYGLPAELTSLPGGIPHGDSPPPLDGGLQGENDFGNLGYDGPAPPEGSGPHRYRFTVYALDEELGLDPGLDASGLMDEIGGHAIGQGRLTATYERG